jgi:2-polyprenyl-3-methyl-5-hydroxy-6-metoxy-1,4-benzoquinol methylase
MKKVKKTILSVYQFFCKIVLSPVLLLEQKYPRFPNVNERTVEYAYAFKQLQKIYPINILDVGTGISSWPHILSNCGYRVTAIDLIDGYWSGTFFNRHFKVINDNVITPKKIKEKFELITCISVLEHIPDHEGAMKSMMNMLKEGGHLLVTCPYNENIYHENIYKHPDFRSDVKSTFITQIYSRKQIEQWLAGTNCELIDQEYYQIFEGPLWSFGKLIKPSKKVEKTDLHHLTCLLIKKTK